MHIYLARPAGMHIILITKLQKKLCHDHGFLRINILYAFYRNSQRITKMEKIRYFL